VSSTRQISKTRNKDPDTSVFIKRKMLDK